MSDTAGKKDLAADIAKATGLSQKDSQAAIDAMFDSIAKRVKKSQRVSIIGVGSFSLVKRAARQGRNPKTGEPMKIKASKSIGFKISPAYKSRV